jgi:tetratricopeptide (TPR) repeat protein
MLEKYVTTDKESSVDRLPEAIEAREALQAVLSSQIFGSSKRLKQLLSYVVEEKLAGRAERIRGKTIAEDVYSRKISGDLESEPAVRVDASRLRRRLAQYYAEAGQQDPIRIEIPTGTYVPNFVPQAVVAAPAVDIRSSQSRFLIWGAVCASILFVGGALVWIQFSPGQVNEQSSVGKSDVTAIEGRDNEEIRRAMFDKSPAALQAYVFAQQARGLIWPPTDPVRRQTALDLFERTQEIDPSYSGGYAGAAQVLAFMAFMPGPGDKNAYLKKARAMALHAQGLDPSDAWVQSALAWVHFVSRDYEQALILTERASRLDSQDPFVRDFHAAILVLSGEFDAVQELLAPFVREPEKTTRFVYLNQYAMASFHLRKYQNSIQAIQKITDFGGKISPLTTAYLAASYQAIGDQERAQKFLNRLVKSWPDFAVDLMFQRVFKHQKHADEIMARLKDAGWKSNR